MTVEVTRLPSGLSVVTDRMPHLETASLGVWIGSGSRNEKPDEHGISHLLEHMAFKGTKRRTARQIAETIEAVGGDLNAATSVESTGYFARVLKADVPLAIDVLSDILSEPTFDAEELQARAERHRAGDRRDRRCAGRSGVRSPAGNGVSGAAGRPFHPRHAGDCALIQSDASARLSVTQLHALRTWWSLRPALSITPRSLPTSKSVSPASRDRPRRRRNRRISAAAREWRHAISSRCISPWRWKGCRCATTQLYSLQVFTSVLGGGMSSRLFQEVREIRGLCYTIQAFHMPYADTGLFALYAGTDETDAPELMRVVIDQIGNATETLNDTEINRAKAQMKAGLLMALESSEARVGQLARQMLAYGPADSARRDRRQGRRRHGRKRARRRPRVDQPRQAGDRRARTRQRSCKHCRDR